MSENAGMTIAELIDFAQKSNAGLTEIIGRRADGTPAYIVIAVIGGPQSTELLELIDKMYNAEK